MNHRQLNTSAAGHWYCNRCQVTAIEFFTIHQTNDQINAVCDHCHTTAQWIPAQNAEPMAVPEILRAAAATHEERGKLYGDNYKTVGSIMTAMLPDGVVLKTPEDWNRFLIFGHIINKVTRYAQNINRGGHKDSAHDLIVYAAMLEELTKENAT